LHPLSARRDYDEISVTQILERANVGRSTFYMHFASKDELLLSGMHGMLRSISAIPAPAPAKRHENIVRFSLPILEHVVDQRAQGAAMGLRGRAVLHEHLQNVLTGIIADDVRRHLRGRRKAADQASPELLARFIASTFVLVLNWWLDADSRMSPKEVDAIFRALVLPSVSG
jgi:AcrR family transcriptional regulator